MDTAVTALSGLNRLSVVRQIALLVALAGSVAVGVTVALWSQTPNYTLLYGSLTGKDAAEVLEVLQGADISYRVDQESGAILVASGKVHEARLKLASEGLPRGTDLGFQMLEKKRSFGTSQFIEQARYQRALEVELARSVASLSNVQSARVHLALPKQSVFVRDRKPPSASVLIKLYRGRALEEGQAGAIAHLVAAAIPNLESSSVRVIDESGRLLTAPDRDRAMSLSNEEFGYTERVEAAYIRRIESILSPIVGEEGVRAQVTAELDFTRTEQARESFTPNPEAIRSEQIMEERGARPGAGGAPGALSNQPPGGAVAPELAGGEEGGTQALEELARSRREATRNFEINRTIDHIVTPSVAVRRLSVAVVVDDRVTTNEAGEVVRASRSAEEVEQITALVKEAIGFDEERGDRVNIINTTFTAPLAPPDDLPVEPIWKRAWVWDLGKQLAGALLVLLLIFGVLRPFMCNLVNRDLAEREMAHAEQARLAGGGEGGEPGSDATAALSGPGERVNIDSIKSLVAEDPKRVANVVKTWVDGNG